MKRCTISVVLNIEKLLNIKKSENPLADTVGKTLYMILKNKNVTVSKMHLVHEIADVLLSRER